jgi:hypothetical protein
MLSFTIGQIALAAPGGRRHDEGMKKTLSSWLAALMALGLCACSASSRDLASGAELSPGTPENDGDTESAPIGGQSGNEGAAVPPPCISAGETVVVAVVERLESGCGELRVEQVVTSSEEPPLAAGARVGGVVQRPFTATPPAVGERALAVWGAPGDRCQLQLDCAAVQCGPQPQGDEGVAAWDECASRCVESTRAECEALRQEEVDSGRYALGGTLRLAPLDAAGDARVDWRGATRSVPVEQLLADGCADFFAGLPSAAAPSPGTGEPAPGAGAAPAPAPATPPTCPLPSE